MQISLPEYVTYDVKYFEIDVEPRYWEDAEVNGAKDENGDLIPFRSGDSWKITVGADTGYVYGWPTGTTASIYYKVCDAGRYVLLDIDGEVITEREGYVPNLGPADCGGDYLSLEIDEEGNIEDWKPDLDYFLDV